MNHILLLHSVKGDVPHPVSEIYILTRILSKCLISFLDVYKVSTYQGRSNIQSLINGSNIRYREKNKEKLNEWLNVNRLQLPLRSSTAELTNNVSSSENSVNPEISSTRRDLVDP